jgi:HK97 family phage portal protein
MLVRVKVLRRRRAELEPRRPATADARTVYGTVVRPGNLESATLNFPVWPVSRDGAMTVPAIAACRNLIVGAAVQMGVYRYRSGERLEAGPLLTQPDPDTIWPTTLGGAIDDLLFYGRAYWRVLAFDGAESERNPRGFPIRARWIPFGDVTPDVIDDAGAYTRLEGYAIAGEPDTVSPDEVIRFDSPMPGILATGGRTIANAFAIESAARRFADVDLPAGVLTNEGTEVGDEDAAKIIQDFEEARKTNTIAFLQGMTYERTSINPHDLQLIEARSIAATDCARLFNVPVSMIGASPSGNASALLYSNLSQQLAIFVSDAVAPHLRTLEATLSLPSVTPAGQSVAFDVQTFLRSDPQAAADYALALYAADVISKDETRAFLGIPSTATADLTPGKV